MKFMRFLRRAAIIFGVWIALHIVLALDYAPAKIVLINDTPYRLENGRVGVGSNRRWSGSVAPRLTQWVSRIHIEDDRIIVSFDLNGTPVSVKTSSRSEGFLFPAKAVFRVRSADDIEMSEFTAPASWLAIVEMG